MLEAMLAYLETDYPRYLSLIGQHILIDVISIAICCLIAIPLGYMSAKNDRISNVSLAIASIIMVIPSLALFVLLQPITGIGMVPAVIALSCSSIPMLLINTRSGIKDIDPVYIESALGMGMEKWRICLFVEFPLAMPAIMNGLRIVVVSIIASTAIAAYIGAGGLGFYIKLGIDSSRHEIMYIGAITVAVMAVLADLVLARIQKHQLAKVAR